MKQNKRHRSKRDLTAYNPDRLPEILPPKMTATWCVSMSRAMRMLPSGVEFSTTSTTHTCASKSRYPTVMICPRARRC